MISNLSINLYKKLKASIAFVLIVAAFFSCKKEVTDAEKKIYLKVVNNDSLGGYYDNTMTEVIALPDNTFWIHYRIVYFAPFKDRFEHYDENYNLLKTVNFTNYKFGKFIVNGNDDIVVSAFYAINSAASGFYHFIKLDNQFKILEINRSPEIRSNLNPLINYSYNSFLTKSVNGKYVFGFLTTHGYSGSDSATTIMTSYSNPLQTGIPNWVNKNKYFDKSIGITNSEINDIAADNQNNIYVLSTTSDYSIILRKHSEDGNLIWQKKINNTRYFDNSHVKINIESDRIFISSTLNKLYIFDSNGNYTEKQLPYPINESLIPTKNEDGYITVSDTSYKIGKYATVLKLNKNFELIKLKQYGNQGTNTVSSPRITRLKNGKLVVAGFVETPDLKGVDLMLLKIDDDLELID